jgi:hypothetical protein
MATMTAAPRITGHGHTRTGNLPCYTVESRTDGHWYIVVVHADRLECNCKWSTNRPNAKPCAHRIVVHDRLVEEREAARIATPAYDQALPVAANNNRAFSIWKS